jgi:hypothetical protein
MRKEQALHKFWSSFGVPAYDANTVPEDAPLPRITYEIATDSYDMIVSLTASIWSRSKSWVEATEIKDAIEEEIANGGTVIDGILWITTRTPFAQRMNDPDDSIRRIVLNLNAEYA